MENELTANEIPTGLNYNILKHIGITESSFLSSWTIKL